MQSALSRVRRIAVILFCCWFPIVAICNNSTAQTDSEVTAKEKNSPATDIPKPVPRARWSEDGSTFGDASPLLYPENSPYDFFWGPIKSIPLHKSEESYLNLGGELRLAYEFYFYKKEG
jgi:hypothetical protein